MLPTKQIPINLTAGTSNDCSEIYTGQWNQLMISMRTAFQLRFLPERHIDNGQYTPPGLPARRRAARVR